MSRIRPCIKWSGSKRSQSEEIVKRIDIQDGGTYYEPFLGGASVFMQLYKDKEKNSKISRFILSDYDLGLMNLWFAVRDDYEDVYKKYKSEWNILKGIDNWTDKRTRYERIREEYNRLREPALFMFIMRVTTNGMPRYNQSGEFNNSLHIHRDGINPEELLSIMKEWSAVLNDKRVILKSGDYIDICKDNKQGDFIYMDPPYAHTKGMYEAEEFNADRWMTWMKQDIRCSYMFSYDGISGKHDNTVDTIDPSLYDTHEYLKSGNSSFKRIRMSDRGAMVYESIYIKRK